MGGTSLPISSFTVTKSNPSTNKVRFTITDTGNLLTTSKMIRSVLCDAIQQWIDAERNDLNTNGDDDVTGADQQHAGDGFSAFDFKFGSKYAEVTLTAMTNISASGTITASAPFADVA